jgi:hypothetical protein
VGGNHNGCDGNPPVAACTHRDRTAEDKLLEVPQLTGVLVDTQGEVVRAGAEGILAGDTPFAAQVFDVSKVLDVRTLARVLTKGRRADLPGDPLKWQVP